jgi:hypothetical protein
MKIIILITMILFISGCEPNYCLYNHKDLPKNFKHGEFRIVPEGE